MVAGSRLAFVARFLGRRLASTYEVAELVIGERLVMRTADGPFPMETTYTWEPLAAGGTRMTLRNRGRPAGFSAVVAPFMAGAMRRANQRTSPRCATGWRGPADRHTSGRGRCTGSTLPSERIAHPTPSDARVTVESTCCW